MWLFLKFFGILIAKISGNADETDNSQCFKSKQVLKSFNLTEDFNIVIACWFLQAQSKNVSIVSRTDFVSSFFVLGHFCNVLLYIPVVLKQNIAEMS